MREETAARAVDLKLFLSSVGPGRTISRYRRSQVIFEQGTPSRSVFYIRRGRVKVSVLSRDGKEATIAILGPHEFFGEDCVSRNQPLHLLTASAFTDCTLLEIERRIMIKTLRREVAFSNAFVAFLLARKRRVRADLLDQLFNSSEQRLARVLLLLARFGQDDHPERAIQRISQATLAQMVGTTRSRVNFYMNRFRRMGFIDYNSGGMQVRASLLKVILRD